MRVVYPDEVFLINALCDYAIIILTARITGAPVKRRFCLLAAALGGAYAALAAVFGGFLSSPIVMLAAAGLMAVTVFGKTERFFRHFITFVGVSAAFGGISAAAGGSFGEKSFKLFAAVFLASWAVFSIALRGSGRSAARGEVEDIEISLGQRSVRLRALMDTGNSLRDPISGRRVIICPVEAVEGLFDKNTLALLKSGDDPVSLLPELREKSGVSFSLVPYRAVGVEDGLILCFRPDAVTGKRDDLSLPLIGVKSGLNIDGGGYSAIGYC